jgi:hypothetical protein
MHFTDQRDYQIRFECGERGLAALADCTRFVSTDVGARAGRLAERSE